MGNCNSKPSYFENTFLGLVGGLSQHHKDMLQVRYIRTVEEYRRRIYIYDSVYHYGRFISNLSSILVPALLSIQYSGITNVSNTETYVRAIFWLAWFLSLTVTVVNNTLGLFRVEKKYFLLHIILSQLLAEGYQYAELTGRYSGFLLNSGIQTTHHNQFVFFVHAVERIVMRETDIEYFRLYDANQNLNITNGVGVVGGGTVGGGVVGSVDTAVGNNGDIEQQEVQVHEQLSQEQTQRQTQPQAHDLQHRAQPTQPTRPHIPHAGQALYHPTPEHPITPID